MALSEMIGGLTSGQNSADRGGYRDQQCVLSFRVLEPPTDADKERMREFAHQHDISVCLQSKGPDTIVPLDGEPELIPTYALPDQGLEFKFKPAMFTQVNYEINKQMINRVLETLDLMKTTRCWIYFAAWAILPCRWRNLPVVCRCGRRPTPSQSRQGKCRHNGIENVEFYAADLSKDISDQPWANRKYNKIMLDPSRAGASEILHHFKKWQLSRSSMCPAIRQRLPAMREFWSMSWAINWLKRGDGYVSANRTCGVDGLV